MTGPEITRRWHRIPGERYDRVKEFLLKNEEYYVAACARFLRIRENGGHLWYLGAQEDEISALLLHSRQTLFPVFNKNRGVPGPRFLNRFLRKTNIHAVQGLREEAELLEALMENQGYFAEERIDYNLMSLDNLPKNVISKSVPSNLVLRKPQAGDELDLYQLQAAYEQEEVLPGNSVFNPDSCRHNLKRILSSEQILVAELDGCLVGKINTSAESFTRYQIGGVYVRPDCRGLGIGTRMTAQFSRELLNRGKGLTLFVKKRNIAAEKIYRRNGFSILADYRINYY